MTLSEIGDLCRTHLLGIPAHWDSTILDSWVIMPDHLHMILLVRGHLPEGIPQVVGGFKSGVARDVARHFPYVPAPFWQTRFHDRVLRSREALAAARRYIAANPAQWPG